MATIRTPDQRLRVFVSSTLQEVAAERVAARAAIEHLHLAPVMFELGARPHPPADLYRAYLAQSHVFVGLYWQRYGWVAPDMEISGLEDEWVLAADHPKLVYLKEPATREPRLDELIDRIRADNSTSYRTFTTPEQLRDLLLDDLAVLLSERFESPAGGGDAQLGHAAGVDDVRGPLHAVPNAPSSLVGREAELGALADLVHRDDTRLVTITGPGGSGKTRLALELAAREHREHGRRVAFADLTGIRSADLALPTIAAALGVRDAGDRSLVEAIATVLDAQPVLLVVDNFEHVIETAGELAELLATTGDLQVLVTSRQPLRLRWEHEFPLLPLAVPDPVEQTGVDGVGASPAVQLLVERIQRVHPRFRLDASNVAAVAEIVRRLDGLPLALELAAARMRVLQPRDLLRRLSNRLDVLEARSPDLPARHHTLRATIAWSHEHLEPDEQRVFRRMGVFAGGAGIDAIEAVCADDDLDAGGVLERIENLVDKSLLVSLDDDPCGPRLTMLETIREFAVEQLVAAGESETTWDRHLRWHCDLAERAWAGFWGSEMPGWLEQVEREQDNLRSALDHSVGAGDTGLGLRLGASLWPFWDVRGQYREGERRLAAVLDAAPEDGSLERGRALNARGWLVALQGDFDAAIMLMDEGLAMVRAAGDPHRLAWSLAEQGNVAFSLGRVEDTEQLFGEALALAQAEGDSFLTGLGHFGLAYAAFLRGDLDLMEGRLRQSLQLTRLVVQPWGIAWAQFSLGIVAVMRGDTAAAVAPVTESLRLRWTIRDARGLAESVQLLATLASAHGEADWSALLHGAAELQREAVGLTILPFLRPMHDDSVARLRERLGQEALAERWALGRSMALEKVVSEAVGRAGVGEPGVADGDDVDLSRHLYAARSGPR